MRTDGFFSVADAGDSRPHLDPGVLEHIEEKRGVEAIRGAAPVRVRVRADQRFEQRLRRCHGEDVRPVGIEVENGAARFGTGALDVHLQLRGGEYAHAALGGGRFTR